jgi:hypothetical protein
MEDGTRVRWDSALLFDRVMNCGHSWCLHGSRGSCVQVFILARLAIDLNLYDTLRNG